jgi:hypothetical protein
VDVTTCIPLFVLLNVTVVELVVGISSAATTAAVARSVTITLIRLPVALPLTVTVTVFPAALGLKFLGAGTKAKLSVTSVVGPGGGGGGGGGGVKNGQLVPISSIRHKPAGSASPTNLRLILLGMVELLLAVK